MLLFGHLGIGSTLVRPWARQLSGPAVLLGTLLSDIVDKAAFYGLTWIYGQPISASFIPGTRSFGHTGIFLLAFVGAAIFRRSKLLAALALGISSHLFLDRIMDSVLNLPPTVPLLWPLPGWEFPLAPFHNATEHLKNSLKPELLGCEAIGLILLLGRTRLFKYFS